MLEESVDPRASGGGRAFVTTHWPEVLAAGRTTSPDAAEALAKLYRQYWYPLYGFVRGRGYSHHDAEELTQSFFYRLIQKNTLADLVPNRGRFRSFLLTALTHFLHDERDRANAAKRGGTACHIAIGSIFADVSAQARFEGEISDGSTPETLYHRRWIMVLIQSVLDRLGREMEKAGKARLFDAVKGYLAGDFNLPSYGTVARNLEMTEGALKVAIHRLRQRYQEIFREEIMLTVADPSELHDEVQFLLRLISK